MIKGGTKGKLCRPNFDFKLNSTYNLLLTFGIVGEIFICGKETNGAL